MTGCRVLLLDEPSMGLAPVLKYELFRSLKRLSEEGLTLLLVEQNTSLALHLAHRGYVLDTGVLVASGTGAELLGNPDVRNAYLDGRLHQEAVTLLQFAVKQSYNRNIRQDTTQIVWKYDINCLFF